MAFGDLFVIRVKGGQHMSNTAQAISLDVLREKYAKGGEATVTSHRVV